MAVENRCSLAVDVEPPGYVELVLFLGLVWGVGDTLSTVLAAHVVGSAAGELILPAPNATGGRPDGGNPVERGRRVVCLFRSAGGSQASHGRPRVANLVSRDDRRRDSDRRPEPLGRLRGQLLISQGQSLAESIDEGISPVVRFRPDDVAIGDDVGSFALVGGFDEVVGFEVRQGRLEVIDVDVDGRPQLEDSHPIVAPVGERIEYRHFRLLAITVLRLRLHSYSFAVAGLTLVPAFQAVRLYLAGGDFMAMGIKCSLFGHDFGETTVERDREEQGNEVVSTIREVETCRRCGETRVVSENTEVTTIKTPEDVDVDSDDGDEPDPDSTGSQTDAGAAIIDAEDEEPVSDTETPPPEPSEDDMEYESAAEDDGVILEDDIDEDPDRDPGEWPDDESHEDTVREDDESDDGVIIESEQPEAAVEDEPQSEEVDPAVVMDATDDATDEESTDDAEVWSSTRPDLESASADVQSGGADAVRDGQFRCTECGFTTPIEASSLREGDYCPECHQGMLVVEDA